MRWFLLLVGACAAGPQTQAVQTERQSVARARVAIESDQWLDVTVGGWRAVDRCDSLVREQLEKFGLARNNVTRSCAVAVLPRMSAAYQLVTFERSVFLTPPNARYTIETIVAFDTRDACEMRKAQIEAKEAKAFDQEALERRRAVEKRIADVKRNCDAPSAKQNDHDTSCACDAIQVQTATFRPKHRICRSTLDAIESHKGMSLTVDVHTPTTKTKVQLPRLPSTRSTNTGVIQGVVLDSDGCRVVEHVTVIVTSPALARVRTAITDEAGVYNINELPTPAEYIVTFYYAMSVVEHAVRTNAGEPTTVSPRISSRAKESCDGFAVPPGSICLRFGGKLIKLAPDGTRR